MNTTSLNSATGSVLGLAELIGISHGKMRTLIGHLCAAGLITSESSNKGTAFRLTDRGEQVLNFTSADVDDFSTILSVIQRPFGIAILHIIKQLTHNALRKTTSKMGFTSPRNSATLSPSTNG